MFTITLNGKTKEVPFVTALALRELKRPLEILDEAERKRASEDESDRDYVLGAEEMDQIVRWFCVFLQNAFTPEEIYAHYPADQLLRDVHFAALTVQRHVTAALTDFPLRLAREQGSASGT